MRAPICLGYNSYDDLIKNDDEDVVIDAYNFIWLTDTRAYSKAYVLCVA